MTERGGMKSDLPIAYTFDFSDEGDGPNHRNVVDGNGGCGTEPDYRALADVVLRSAIPQTVITLDTLNPVAARDLMTTDIPEQDPVAAGLLYPENVLVIGGLVKARKTWLTLQFCMACVSGTEFVGHEVPQKHSVLYIGGEGSDRTIRKRLLQAAAHFPGLEDDDLENLGVVSSLGRVKLDTPAGEEWLQRVSAKYTVIAIDPYYRFLSVGSENIHEDQRKIQDVFDRLKATGKAVIIAHHLRKPTGNDAGAAELRGAGMDAFADSILILSRKKVPAGDRFTLKYILRHDEEPSDLSLVPMGPLLQIADEDSLVKSDDVVRVIREAGGRVDGRTPIEDALMKITGASRVTCKRAIQRAETSGRIYSAKREGVGQSKTYILGDGGISGHES